jgi:site-specific DNA-methyltransferase (adenine-specific)
VSEDQGSSLVLKEPGQVKRAFHLFAQSAPISGIRGTPISITSEREFGVGRKIVTETKEFSPLPFFRFFGMWLGDGYACSRNDNHPANDFFGFSVKKPRKIASIRATLTSLGIRFTETPGRSNGKTNFYCYDFALLGFLKTLGKAEDKLIPNWMFDRDATELEELYQGLIETDGCQQGKNQEVYYTVSKRLADDFQRLCLHTGRSAISVLKKGGYPITICGRDTVASDAWSLCVLQPGKKMYGEKSDRSSNVIFEQPYEGQVYCVGVEHHHILYTRYNGKPVWSGNSWDGSGIERDPEFWRLIHDILLPGGFVFAFSGSRTGHWQACAMEAAGFIMHPMTAWVFASGMPKAHNPCPQIDRIMGASGERTIEGDAVRRIRPGADQNKDETWEKLADQNKDETWEKLADREYVPGSYIPASPEAQAWDGWRYGTQSQKPAMEPIYLGQKPFSEKTGAENLLKHGVGAFNIDGCRVPTNGEVVTTHSQTTVGATSRGIFSDVSPRETHQTPGQALGRWPANLFHDGSPEVLALFPDSAGQLARVSTSDTQRAGQNTYGAMARGSGAAGGQAPRGDAGSAARFFNSFPADDVPPIHYNPKAGKADRAGSRHPTVKPIALLRHLIRHITPPGGLVLDPFAGSGTTAEAARQEGFDCVLIEADPDYVYNIQCRFDLPGRLPTESMSPEILDLLGFDLPKIDTGINDLLG